MPLQPLAAGVWGVVATPFTDALQVDHESLRRLVTNYENLGATGLTVLGVFGEAAKLDDAERAAVLRTVLDAVSLPIVVGATSLATAPAVEEVGRIVDITGDRLAAAMVQVNTPNPDALATHLGAVHERTGAGIVVQDYPAASGVSIPLAAEIQAVSDSPSVVAVKQECAPTAQRTAALVESLDVPVFGGLGGINLIDELAAGSAGAMTGFSYPEGLLAAIAAHRDSGFTGARDALLPYLPLIAFEQQPAIALGIRKYCLARRGLIDSAAVRPPAPSMPGSLRPIADAHLDAVSRLVSA